MASSRLRNIQQQLASGGKGGSPPYASPQPLAGDDGVPVITNVKAIKTVGNLKFYNHCWLPLPRPPACLTAPCLLHMCTLC